jgi:acetolactate synthase-1/3 small subunit
MVKVATATPDIRSHVMQLVDVFRARVVDVAPDAVIIETTGTEAKINGLLEVLQPYGILELVRTGRIGMVRGAQSVMVEPPDPPRVTDKTSTDDGNISYSV